LQYKAAGKYPVTLVVRDKRGCTTTVTREVEIKAVAYNRTWRAEQFNAFPNPTTDNFLTVDIPTDIDTEGGLRVEVRNQMGSLVQQYEITGTGKNTLDLGPVANGIYLLQISGKDGSITRKFQVIRR
jgi:hypothetical protein